MNSEGNGGFMNYNIGEEGIGAAGRFGALASFATRKDIIVVMIDPITETLKRGPSGLCILVRLTHKTPH